MIHGSSRPIPTETDEIKEEATINEYYGKEAETRNATIPASEAVDVIRNATPDVEYDEFKQSDDNIIEMRKAEDAITKPADIAQNGQIRIVDMSKEQLQNAVVNLMNVQQQLEATLKEYQARAKRIQQIWNSKEHVKARYFMLRDNPKAKGVKVT